MEIEKIMLDALNKIKSAGLIEKAIQDQIEKTIKEIISDLFRSYSDFGKDLKEKLSESIKLNVGNIDLPRYNVMIENAIKEQTTLLMNSEHKKLIDERLKDVLKIEEKSVVKLSEIVSQIIEEETDRAHENGWESGSFHAEGHNNGKGLTFVRIDPEPGKEKYRCEIDICIHNDTGFIHSAEVGEYKSKNFSNKFLGTFHGAELLIFRLYSQGVKIIVDVDDCEAAIHYPDRY